MNESVKTVGRPRILCGFDGFQPSKCSRQDAANSTLDACPPRSTMRAAVITAPRRIDILETQIPQPSANQLLVRIEGCGVCASNIPPWEGKPWFTYPMPPGALGHEAWGRGAEVGRAVRGDQGHRMHVLPAEWQKSGVQFAISQKAIVLRFFPTTHMRNTTFATQRLQ